MTFRDGRFKGKVAIVSGGADGMGAACVNQLSAEGAKSPFWTSKLTSLGDLGETAENGASVEAFEVDVTNETALRDALTLQLSALERLTL